MICVHRLAKSNQEDEERLDLDVLWWSACTFAGETKARTKDASFEVQQCPWVTRVHRSEKEVHRKRVWDGRPSAEAEQQLAFATKIGDEQLQEGVDDECLMSA